MYSAPALMIIAGLCLLGLASSIFPVGPTPISAASIFASAILCFFLPVYIGIFAALLVLGLFIADAFLARTRIDTLRVMPTHLARGVPADFHIVTSTRIQHAPSYLHARIRQPRCADIQLSPQQATTDLHGKITAHRRGLHTLPPYAVRVRGPLWFATWHRPESKEHTVKVFPDLPAAYRLAHSIQRGQFSTAGLKRKGPLGLGTNFESVREYFPDDDVRNVNWTAMARMGRPMTNQYRVEQDRDVIALIDTGRLMTAPLPLEDSDNEFEYRDYEDDDTDTERLATRLDIALDAVCGLVSVADVMGDRSGVIAFNSTVHKHLRPRRAGARAVIRTIYDLDAIPVDSDFDAACQRVGKAKRSFVLILTDMLDAQSARPLVRALRTLVHKHRVVVASIVDPDVAKILDDENNDVYIKSGAEQMAYASKEAIDMIKNVGAEVVYCDHSKLMLECVKTYLGAKQKAAF